jgi:hypothetical protein
LGRGWITWASETGYFSEEFTNIRIESHVCFI